MSSHYRFCLVTVRMKVLHNRKRVRFSKRTSCWCTFSCSICNQNGQLIGLSSAPVSKVMTAFKSLGKALSAKRNTGRKPKLSERDRRILKGIVSKNHRTAAAKLTAEINIHLEDRFHKNRPLITENNSKRWKI